ncbi:hypothetical protein VPH35_020240 [Triticum aestivum]|uniref:uncharacterized protein n=1 Tax=Triticum aestivum TaxID=4565 RepID=UPI00084258F9|nr:uncharacterized protein LOC123185082 [Triticum aestivum]
MLPAYKGVLGANPMAISFQKPPSPINISVVREKSGAREMDGHNLETMILNTAVPLMAMQLLLTASAVSMTPVDSACACLRTCFFGSNCFPMICVLCQINLGRLLATEAALSPALAGRRYYAVGAVACVVELALKLCVIMVLCPADGV